MGADDRAQDQHAPHPGGERLKPYRYQPGETGNPGGRPQGADVRALLRKKIAARPREDGFGEMAHKIADLVLDIAEKKVTAEDLGPSNAAMDAIKWATEQALGKLTTKIETEDLTQRITLVRRGEEQDAEAQSEAGTAGGEGQARPEGAEAGASSGGHQAEV